MTQQVVRAIIPSYRPEPGELTQLVERLTLAGAEPVVLANGRPAVDASVAAGHPHLAPGTNSGFGPSIAWAVERLERWDWLLLVNDDIRLEVEPFRAALETLDGTEQARIVHLDEDVPRRVPRATDVFTNVSLLARVAERLRPASSVSASASADTYRSFSCVAINRVAWDLTGGFDLRLPFTYEDADLVRRLRAVGGAVDALPGAGVVHEGSKSSSRSVRTVLPVATWSALVYLMKWTSFGPVRGRAVVFAALAVRLVTFPLGRADRRAHLSGILAAMRAVLRRTQPPMPPYDPPLG